LRRELDEGAEHMPVVEKNRAAGRIVVGVDGSEPSKEALRWAAQQAEMTGSELEVVMTWNIPVVAAYGGVMPVPTDADEPRQYQAVLDQLVQEVLGESRAAR